MFFCVCRWKKTVRTLAACACVRMKTPIEKKNQETKRIKRQKESREKKNQEKKRINRQKESIEKKNGSSHVYAENRFSCHFLKVDGGEGGKTKRH